MGQAFMGNSLNLHRPSTSKPDNVRRAAARIEDYVDPDLEPELHRSVLEMVFRRPHPTKLTSRGRVIAEGVDA